VGIRAVLSKEKKTIAFLSEKVNEARTTKVIYIWTWIICRVYRSLKSWESYLIASDFVLFSDHQSLQHFKNQKHINKMYARLASYFEQFNFMIHHKSGVANKVLNAWSQKVSLIVWL